MNKTRYYPPYLPTGKTRFAKTQGKTGVYLITENDKVVYIGYSASNLYKTMYRHFQDWNHSGQEVITYFGKIKRKSYKVRVVFCGKHKAMNLERALIMKHQPRDNSNKYTAYKATAKDRALIAEYQSELTQTLEEAPF